MVTAEPKNNDTSPRIHKKKDGSLLVEHDGSARYLTSVERIQRRLFGRTPRVKEQKDEQ